MQNDRNKTELTRDVTAAAITYLDEKGFKPIETEVVAAEGWIADIASASEPTRTEAIKLKLLPTRAQYRYDYLNPERVVAHSREVSTKREAWDHLYKQLPAPLTAIVEVKTTRADFVRDAKKWTAPPVANLQYLAVPRAMLSMGWTWPDGWGVLLMNANKTISLGRVPTIHAVSAETKLSLILQIAMRRDHSTRYARLREFQRQARQDRNTEVNRHRWTTAIHVTLIIALGGHDPEWPAIGYASVQDVLDRHGIKTLSKKRRDYLDKLWGVLNAQVQV